MATNWLINLLVLLGVLAIVCVAGWYVLSQMQLTEPVRKIVIIVFVIVAAVIAIIILLGLPGVRIGEVDRPSHVGAVIPAVPDIMRER
jgi:small-conductance mechanosensitive channel